MQLIFVRHAEPDYSVDSLTPKGFREAELLARRTAAWKPTACFCSPAGRAQATAKPSLAAMGVEAETLGWMAEFTIGCHARPDGSGDQSWVPWDLFPDYWTADPRYNDPEGWLDTPYLQAHADVARPRWAEIKAGIDGVLARYGYRREANHYRIAPDANRDALLVFFCHLGLAGAAIGHITHVAPPALWHGLFMAPSSVTVLNSEERQGDIAGFRCQVFGDTSHLRDAGEPPSRMGSFGRSVFPF